MGGRGSVSVGCLYHTEPFGTCAFERHGRERGDEAYEIARDEGGDFVTVQEVEFPIYRVSVNRGRRGGTYWCR